MMAPSDDNCRNKTSHCRNQWHSDAHCGARERADGSVVPWFPPDSSQGIAQKIVITCHLAIVNPATSLIELLRVNNVEDRFTAAQDSRRERRRDSPCRLVVASVRYVGLGSRAAVMRCAERVSLAPESRPTASSIDYLFSANCRHLANLPNHRGRTPRTHRARCGTAPRDVSRAKPASLLSGFRITGGARGWRGLLRYWPRRIAGRRRRRRTPSGSVGRRCGAGNNALPRQGSRVCCMIGSRSPAKP